MTTPTDRAVTFPTGRQWTIGHGAHQAVVTEVGATLRAYSVDGAPVIDGFEPDQWSHDGRGQVLAPWPNRLGDGRYEFGGAGAQVPLDEPQRGNAIHGLVRWLPWTLEAHAQNRVVLSCLLRPTPAYPYLLRLRVEYRLGRGGLTVSTVASNEGDVELPFGLGFHPYFTVGTAFVDAVVLELPASDRLVLDERGLPTGEVRPVAGTEYDFTMARVIGPTQLDTAYAHLRRHDDGRAWVAIEDPVRDRSVTVWMDEAFDYVMCYTGDGVGEPARRRRSVAVEPMTCPPNALRSGEGVVTVRPGQRFEATWGVRTG